MKTAASAFLMVLSLAFFPACDGSVGNADSCAGVCQWNTDCMLSYFESESICETRCLNDEADGINQDVWNDIRLCTSKYREYYLCLELQNCIDAIENLELITDGVPDGDDTESEPL